MKLFTIMRYVNVSNISNDAQLALAGYESFYFSNNLAHNNSISESAQLILAKKRVETRLYLATNTNLSESAQSVLLKDNDYRVIFNLAKNPGISEETQLIICAGDVVVDGIYPRRCFRNVLVGNPNISEKVQLILAEDDDWLIRRKLSYNPNISEKTKLILKKRSNLERLKRK